MISKYLLPGLLTSLLSLTAVAQEFPTPPDLPPTILARQVLDADPGVAAARALLEASRADAEMFAAGPYEFSTRLIGQRRDVQSRASYGEWSVGLERSVRLPGKASLDRAIGQQVFAEAEARYGDALHQASRDLLKLWMTWLGAEAAHTLLAEQRSSAEENLRAVKKRFRAGDAARLDIHMAEAELEDIKRRESETRTESTIALANLQGRFPGIQARPTPLSQARTLERDLAFWKTQITAHSHELRIPQAQLARAQTEAKRARAERLPDPTLGIHAVSELGGAERIIGLSVSIPIPGARRGLEAARAESALQAARAQLNMQTRMVETETSAAVARAQGAYASWEAADRAAAAMRANAQLMQRAYKLGEVDLQNLLLARRQALDSSLITQKNQIEALNAQYLLLVDAHLIWDMETSDHDE